MNGVRRTTTVEYFVSFGSGHSVPLVYSNFEDALESYYRHKAIPSYIDGRDRQGSLVKITTLSEDLTPR